MNIVNLEHISKAFGDKVLFEDIHFGVHAGERIGLIGVNGSGKSTLFKIIADQEQPDKGSVTVRNDARIAYLSQDPPMDPEQTVLAYIYQADTPAQQLLRRYMQVTNTLEAEPDNTSLIDELAHLSDALTSTNSWDIERAARTTLSRLGVDNVQAKLGNLSGGQRKRVALARVLIEQPDLLILDEPTNHIDPDTIAWLEGYLATLPGALLMITHDRYFLDRVVTRIIELDDHTIYSYPGNYETFVQARFERSEQQAAADVAHRNAVRREQAWLRRGPQGRTTKQKARIDRATALIDQERNGPSDNLELQISGRRMGKKLLTMENISKQLDNTPLIADFSYELERFDRLGIIGPNGTGKSTLLNMIAERIQPDSGEIIIGETLHIAYYDQTSSNLDPEQRLIDYISEAAAVIRTPDGGTITAGQMLERFLFPVHQHWSKIETLSGGERRRLYLLRTLLQNPNVLLLDEPSNDLDVQTIAVLEEYLENFPGAVIIVSHDRSFLDNTVEHLLIFDQSPEVKRYPGNYSAYHSAQQAQETQQANAQKAKTTKPSNDKRSDKLSYKEQRELEQLEKQIAKLEAHKETLSAQINQSGSDYNAFNELTQQYDQTNTQLETAFERWAELADRAGE